MNARNIPQIDLAEVMAKIRAEIDKNRTQQSSSDYFENFPLRKPKRLDLQMLPEGPAFEMKRRGYNLKDFLKFHGVEFIDSAYIGILGREPDPEGYEYYLHNLRTGTMTKVEILGRLRFSPEGRAKSVIVKGLLPNFLIQSLFRVPVVGYFSRLFTGILNLPAIIKNFERLECYSQTRFIDFQNHNVITIRSIQDTINEMSDQLLILNDLRAGLERLDAIELELTDSRDVLYTKADRIELQKVSSGKADRSEVEKLAASKVDISAFEDLKVSKVDKTDLAGLASILTQQQQNLDSLQFTITDLERRYSLLVEKHLNDLVVSSLSLQQQTQTLMVESSHLLDSLYLSFEDQFRGTRSDIKDRIRIYLPYIRKAGAGSADSPILDLGCGRGEWLEFCSGEGLTAKGVDNNRIMIELCRVFGLDVIEADLLDYLSMHDTDNFGAITAFHIVEHLSFKQIIGFFDGAFRALKPGGTLIVETPNPDNMMVASRDFYQDPTHRNPLPSSTLLFIAKARGFTDLEILPLNPVPDYARDPEVTGKLRDLIYGPQDYALIGKKPSQ